MMSQSAAPPMFSSPLQRFRSALILGLAGLGASAGAAPYIPFPSPESLREVQLAALACARENSAASCDRARTLADPLMDHPRLPASCKDLVWTLLENARPAAVNSFERRERLSDPAQRLVLVCRSAEKPAPAKTEPKPSGGGGFGFGGS